MTGIKNYSNPHIRYEQTRNAVEAIILRILKERLPKDDKPIGYLESCGACAFCCLMEGMGYLQSKDYFTFPTGARVQMDDAVMLYLNDPARGYTDIMPNRTALAYRAAALDLYNVQAKIIEPCAFNMVIDEIRKHHGVQLCLEDPGHWIAAIAYDDIHREIVFMDSWGERPGLKNGGINERLTEGEYNSNVKKFMVVYL
jgi:hypothetical protein